MCSTPKRLYARTILIAAITSGLVVGIPGTLSSAHAKKKVVEKKTAKKNDKESTKQNETEKSGEREDTPEAKERELAIRSLGVAVFTADKSAAKVWSPSVAAALCDGIATDLKAKSYFEATCVKNKVTEEQSADALREFAKRHEVDGVLMARVSDSGFVLSLLSGSTGRVIARFKAPLPGKMNAEGQSAAISGIVDEVVRGVPFRGFLTFVDGDDVRINLGSRHGVQVGMSMKVFSFAGGEPSFTSTRNPIATIEVTELKGTDTSVGRITERHGPIHPYAKISHQIVADETPEPGAVRVAEKGLWFTAGAEIFSVATKATDLARQDRVYNLSGVPFMQFGVGGEKWFTQLVYGFASNDEESLSYASALGAYQLKNWATATHGLSLSVGAWLSQFSATTRRSDAPVKLADSYRYSPYLELRYQFTVASWMKAFLSLEGYYPAIATAQKSAMLFFSGGVGSVAGVRFHILKNTSAELGARAQYLTLPTSGSKGLTETQIAPFVRALIAL